MHWYGHIVNRGTKDEALDESAPHRLLSAPRDLLTMAFIVPQMAESGQIPKRRVPDLVRRLLSAHRSIYVDGVLSFRYSKMPYRWNVSTANIAEGADWFMELRSGGWRCKEHQALIECDIPAKVLDRDGLLCIICGSDRNVFPAYMVPLDQKGKTTLSNIATTCWACAERRRGRNYWQFLQAQGVPLDDLVIDFETGFVRSVVAGNKVRL